MPSHQLLVTQHCGPFLGGRPLKLSYSLSKVLETICWVPLHEFMRLNTKSFTFSWCLVTIHKEWCLIQNRYSLASYWNGLAKLTLHRHIYDIGWRVPCAYPGSNTQIFSKFEKWKVKISKISPKFQNSLRYTTSEWAHNRKFPQKMIEPIVLSLFWRTLRITRVLNRFHLKLQSMYLWKVKNHVLGFETMELLLLHSS